MENIRLRFVLAEKYNDENEASQIMIQAFEACKQNVKTDVSWVKENNFDTVKLNKTDFVIFEDFKGAVFNRLKETKCARILGPWAISICLMEGKAIPNFPWPIYNVAMYECIVTSSNLSKSIKLEIKEKVQIMGGCYVDNLVEKVTHLVTDNPKSEKYLAAAEAGVTLMCSSWIDAVWVASQTANIHAKDKEFDKHCCLPFQNLIICSTGLSGAKERKELEKLVTEYGGEYSARLNLRKTDILVCSGIAGATSEKYKAARKQCEIKCVDISWITESIKKGYSLAHTAFPVKKSTSTPTKLDSPVNPDFSVLSAIGFPNTSQLVSIEESIIANASPGKFGSPSKPGPSKRKGNLKEEYAQLVDKLDIKKAKKAGQYLDGCSVYITGFSPEHTDKLCKILNLSGATRYDQFSDRVTHVIVGDPKYPEVRNIQSKGYQCLMVSVHWLLDSIDKEQPVVEDKYLLSTSDLEKSSLGSPLSKKGLSLLRSNKTITGPQLDEINENTAVNIEIPDDDILQQYLKPNTTQDDDTLAQLLRNADNRDFSKQLQEPPKAIVEFKPSETSTQQTTTDNEYGSQTTTMFFEGLKFIITGFDDEDFEYIQSIKTIIEGYGGQLVPKTYKGIPDYIVVPAFNKNELRHTANEIVNEFFIKQCELDECLVNEICYYHRPLELPETAPLANCVITISGYSSLERNFLADLIEGLGGKHQEQFARVTSEARGVVASTHLVSDKPSGKKYVAALKWVLPVVNKDWLMECVKRGVRVPEKDYGVDKGTAGTDENMTPSKSTTKIPHNASTTNVNTKSNDLENVKRPASLATTTALKTSSESTGNCSTPTVSANKSMSTMNCSQFNTPTGVGAFNASTSTGKLANTPGSSKTSRVLTPVNQRLPRMNLNESNDKFSQATPVNKIVQQYRDAERTPAVLNSPDRFRWMGVNTPKTPLGACIRPDPSPQLKKECEFWLQQFPDLTPPAPRRLSTPLSEIKRQLWDKILKKGENDSEQSADMGGDENEAERMEVESNEDCFTPPENTQNRLINNKLQQLEDMLSASSAGKRQSRNFHSTIPIPEGNTEYKDSQACTVGWDFRQEEPVQSQVKIFMLSGISDSARAEMVSQIESLGATVSDLASYDPSSTHLLCPKPARNEKTLSFMAAGKWILHTLYLEKSLQAGRFIDEEEFEFGNPKSVGKFPIQLDKDIELRMQIVHWWRLEVARRGYKAFNDMRAIVVAQKRDPIIRVIEAGGGVVVDVKPPFEDTVHATHCLLEQRSVGDFADYIPLAQQGVFLLNTLYISDYLYYPKRPIKEFILPYFANYYSRC